MGLFDRTIWKKRRNKNHKPKILQKGLGEVMKMLSHSCSVSNKPSQSDEAKISAMEAYYAELKERMAAESARPSQESKASSEKVPLEEPVNQETVVSQKRHLSSRAGNSPEEVSETSPDWRSDFLDAESSARSGC